MNKITVKFYHGALADPYEKQAREQGFTLGDKAELMDELAKGLVMNMVHGILIYSDYEKALKKLHKMILKNLKRVEERTE